MVIPIAAGVILYKEGMPVQKIVGLILALLAVLLINQREETAEKKDKSFLLPLLLFIGCGAVDTSIKFTQHYYISDSNRQVFIMSLFASAGMVGLVKYLYDFFRHHKKIKLKSITGGLILGICNYFSLYFLIKSFEYPGAESSKVFAVVNSGVVLTCSLCGILIFSEKLNRYKITGIAISMCAILTLYFV
jgi:drug/metabolite transporter (DMT)-like permease